MPTNPRKLDLIVKKSLARLKIKDSYADVFLVSNAEIKKLNKKFRGKNKPTNVLSFPFAKNFPEPTKGKKFLGEIYLSPKYIKDHGENIEFMLVHGLLHLLGFNHIKKSDRIKMERQEKRLMELVK